MFNVVFVVFEILLNIGNVICLCVNIGVYLYLIELFGFLFDDVCMCCVGFDYYEYV